MRTLFQDVDPDLVKLELLPRFFRDTMEFDGSPRDQEKVSLGSRFSIVISGSVAAWHIPKRRRGAPIRLHDFEAGDFLGEAAALFGCRPTARLETQEKTKIAFLICDEGDAQQRSDSQRKNLLRLIDECPPVGYNLAIELAWRLARTIRYRDADAADDRIRYAVALRHLERVGHLSQVSASDHPVVPMREELAADAGITSKSVTRAMHVLCPDPPAQGPFEKYGTWYRVRSWESLIEGLYL